MSLAVDILSWVFLSVGSLLVLSGGIGVLRLHDVYTRMHAASLTDTGASLLILIGLILQAGFILVAVKLAATLFFLLFTGPTASYALGNALLKSDVRPKDASGRTLDMQDRS